MSDIAALVSHHFEDDATAATAASGSASGVAALLNAVARRSTAAGATSSKPASALAASSVGADFNELLRALQATRAELSGTLALHATTNQTEVLRADADRIAAHAQTELTALSRAATNVSTALNAHTATAQRVQTVLATVSAHSDRVKRAHDYVQLIRDVEAASVDCRATAEAAAGIKSTAPPSSSGGSTAGSTTGADDSSAASGATSTAAFDYGAAGYSTPALIPVGRAMRAFRKLFVLFRLTIDTPAVQLRSVCGARLRYAIGVLKPKLFTVFRDSMNAIGWPQSRRGLLSTEPVAIGTFARLFEDLVTLQVADDQINEQLSASSTPAAAAITAPTPAPTHATAASADFDTKSPLAATTTTTASNTSDEKTAPTNTAAAVPPTSSSASSTAGTTKLRSLWALQLIMAPLALKFRYHFEGEKKTNRLDKPEWVLNFALQLIEQHTPFLMAHIQSAIARSARDPAHTIRTAFIESLLTWIRTKLARDMPVILTSNDLFRHTLNEVLVFENKLRAFHSYPASLLSCVSIFSDASLLEHWMSVDGEWVSARLERIQSMELPYAPLPDLDDDAENTDLTRPKRMRQTARLSAMDSSTGKFSAAAPSAASVPSSTSKDQLITESSRQQHRHRAGEPADSTSSTDAGADSDSVRPTRSSHAVLELVAGITDRYRLLPALSARYRFLTVVQLKLLAQYRTWIEAAAKAGLTLMQHGMNTPLQRSPEAWVQHCGILNSLQYVETVLREWTEQIIFIELQYYKVHNLPESTTVATLAAAMAASASTSGTGAVAASTSASAGTSASGGGGGLDVRGSLFDGLISEYETCKLDLLHSLVDLIAESFQSNTTEYRQNGYMWATATAAAPSAIDSKLSDSKSAGGDGDSSDSTLDISASLCDPLATLKVQLILIERHSGCALFERFWCALADRLDALLFRDIACTHYFTPAGVAQFRHDITVALWSLFRSYTPIPQNYFRRLRDGLLVLACAAPDPPAATPTTATAAATGTAPATETTLDRLRAVVALANCDDVMVGRVLGVNGLSISVPDVKRILAKMTKSTRRSFGEY